MNVRSTSYSIKRVREDVKLGVQVFACLLCLQKKKGNVYFLNRSMRSLIIDDDLIKIKLK